jgi:hypothetical protein
MMELIQQLSHPWHRLCGQVMTVTVMVMATLLTVKDGEAS